jgi:hypothetical protein
MSSSVIRQIVTGDDDEIVINLFKKDSDGDDQTFLIDSGATVKAQLRKRGTFITEGPVFTLSNSANGADWSVSKVVVEIASAESATLKPDWYDIELQVDDAVNTPGKKTWVIPGIQVIKGTI